MEARVKNLKDEILLPLPFAIDQFQEDEISSFVAMYENYLTKWWQIMESLVKMTGSLKSGHKSKQYSLKTLELIDQYKFKVIQIEFISEQLNSTRAHHILDILRDVDSPFYAGHASRHVPKRTPEDFKDSLKFLEPLRPVLQRVGSNWHKVIIILKRLIQNYLGYSEAFQTSGNCQNIIQIQIDIIRCFFDDVVNVIGKALIRRFYS